jgi:uncharacterized Fe-S cluster protein YjdI
MLNCRQIIRDKRQSWIERDKLMTYNRKYNNEEITVYWKPDACVHASYCYRELIEVFDPGKRPWVNMEGAPTSLIIETVNLCPTEALTWKWNDDEKNKTVGGEHTNHIKFRRPELMDQDQPAHTEDPVVVKIMKDGPIVIKGNFTIKYDDGNIKEVKESLISFCRCGESKQMPFCDGSHKKR